MTTRTLESWDHLGVCLPQTHLCFKGEHPSLSPHQSHCHSCPAGSSLPLPNSWWLCVFPSCSTNRLISEAATWQWIGVKHRSRESESPGSSLSPLLTQCDPGLSTSSTRLETCRTMASWVVIMIKYANFCYEVNRVWFTGKIQDDVILYESGQASL